MWQECQPTGEGERNLAWAAILPVSTLYCPSRPGSLQARRNNKTLQVETHVINRRTFLGNAAGGLAACGWLTPMRAAAHAIADANGLDIPLGCQSHVFREEISQKPRETMSRLRTGHRARLGQFAVLPAKLTK